MVTVPLLCLPGCSKSSPWSMRRCLLGAEAPERGIGAQQSPACVQPLLMLGLPVPILSSVAGERRDRGEIFLVKRKRDSPKLCTQTVISDRTSACYLEGNAARRWPGKAWQRLQADFFLMIRFTIKMNSTINIDMQFN